MRICTTNPGKLREFGGLLAPLGIKLTPTTQHDVPETGDTVLANARQKAAGYAALYPDEYILTEDSGLVVPALGGLPGPWSARFTDLDLATLHVRESGRDRSIIDPLNNERVLDLLGNEKNRGAYFVCVLNLTLNETRLFEIERRVYGWITDKPRGEGGFGYDPIFESPQSYGKTWAEVDSLRKNLMSHRQIAVFDLMAWLASHPRDWNRRS